MKKSKLLKFFLTAVVSFCMIVAFAGCDGDSNSGGGESGGDDQETTVATEEATEEETTEATEENTSDDYDISEGLAINEIDEETLELKGNGFTLTMPNTGTWSYKVNNGSDMQSLTLYYLTAEEAGIDSYFVDIIPYDLDDTSYEELPSYAIAGESTKLGKRFIAMFPTDVRYDPNDETQEEEYMVLLNHVKTINATNAGSPFHVDE